MKYNKFLYLEGASGSWIMLNQSVQVEGEHISQIYKFDDITIERYYSIYEKYFFNR